MKVNIASPAEIRKTAKRLASKVRQILNKRKNKAKPINKNKPSPSSKVISSSTTLLNAKNKKLPTA